MELSWASTSMNGGFLVWALASLSFSPSSGSTQFVSRTSQALLDTALQSGLLLGSSSRCLGFSWPAWRFALKESLDFLTGRCLAQITFPIKVLFWELCYPPWPRDRSIVASDEGWASPLCLFTIIRRPFIVLWDTEEFTLMESFKNSQSMSRRYRESCWY